MKIDIRQPGSDSYHTTIDPDVNEVTITENYNGVQFVTADGETLGVAHRDSGFELIYQGHDTPLVEMKADQIIVGGNIVWSEAGGESEEQPSAGYDEASS